MNIAICKSSYLNMIFSITKLYVWQDLCYINSNNSNSDIEFVHKLIQNAYNCFAESSDFKNELSIEYSLDERSLSKVLQVNKEFKSF